MSAVGEVVLRADARPLPGAWGRLCAGVAGNHVVASAAVRNGVIALTGEIYRSRSVATRALRHGNVNPIVCGQIRADIWCVLRHEPIVKEAMRLHLSDAKTGEPMYVIPDARFLVASVGTARLSYGAASGFESLCRRLRVSQIPAWAATERGIDRLVRELRPRWSEEAARFMAMLDAVGHEPTSHRKG